MKVRISVRTDLDKTFKFPQVFDVRSIDTDENIIETHYRLPKPLMGNWFSFKVEFLDKTVATLNIRQISLLRIGAEVIPTSPTETRQTRSDSKNAATD